MHILYDQSWVLEVVVVPSDYFLSTPSDYILLAPSGYP